MAKVEACGALITRAPGHAEYGQVPMPRELADGGLGRVLAAGVCGSDLNLLTGEAPAAKLWPLILGHETVVEVQSATSTLRQRWGVAPGDRVFVEEFIPCGWCSVCRAGDYRVCPHTDFRSERFLRYGRTSLNTTPGLWGGFSEYLYLHPNARLHPVPNDVPSHVAVLATPVANGLRWVRAVAEARPGDHVVVFGPGAHGLGCVLAAREVGAGEVILVGRSNDRHRMSTGASLGASAVLRADRDDIEACVRNHTGGRGADVVIDATGAPGAARLAVQVATHGGRVVIAGSTAGSTDGFPIGLVTAREIRIVGVRGHNGSDIARALQVIARRSSDLEAMTTPTPLTRGGQLLRKLADGEGETPAHHVLIPENAHSDSSVTSGRERMATP